MSMEIREKVKEYADMKKLLGEIQDIMAALEGEIKEAMGEREEITVEGIKVKYTHYTTNRFDSKAFKAEHGAMYAQYTKPTPARRFQVMG